ncbi:ABC transporter ATP-binding protein [Halospeciosus flavus]|uniref:ABC transporter ATP-binding protein n=1 Tax=Halospeciosus flavus TaxID=3032283 RepID=A0ABD5Z7C3_9EURY|nr:ABC transporter ATP-binding protein [Halospeciosus flavus]
MAAIELDGVTKEYGDVVALQNLQLTVDEGEVYGFLGPNGAGKSTTINVLLDFVRPSGGTARVLGYDAQAESVAVRERVGVLPEGFDVYDRLTGREHLQFAVESKGADDDPADILDRVGLADDGDRKAGGYSTGMRQRLALGMALVGDPDLLILDEPSSGLDPAGAKEMREVVRTEADRGATVFFSSHILGQVEAVCDRVGILRDGELVAEDTVEGLRDTLDADARLTLSVRGLTQAALDEVRALDGVSTVDVTETEAHGDADTATVSVACDDVAKAAVVTTLADAGVDVRDFETAEASLEELFLSVAGESPIDATSSAEGDA